MKQSLWVILQSLPNLCKGCALSNFMQVEFYISQNFPKIQLNAIQFFYLVCRKNYKLCFQTYNKKIMELQRPYIFSALMQNMFPWIFKFVPAGKYLRKVREWLYCVCIC